MENIKIENISRYHFLKLEIENWNDAFIQAVSLLETKPDSFFYKCIKKQAEKSLKESIDNFNEYILKYGN